MSNLNSALLPWLLMLLLAGSVLAREETTLAEGWRFIRSDVAGAEQPTFKDRDWQAVVVPHCWGWEEAESGNRNFYRGPGWYRREFTVPADTDERHRRFLWFGAASTVADVYLNGQHISQHRGGFGAFCVEITDAVLLGRQNVLAVRVSNAPEADIAPLAGDFNVYGGLYRPVRLLETGAVCISPLQHAAPGLAVQQKKVTAAQAELEARVEVANGATELQALTVRVMVRDHAQLPVITTEQHIVLKGSQTQTVEFPLVVAQPHLWSGVKDPYLYEVVAEIRQGDRVLDCVAQPLGLRYYRVDPEQGFFLNGQPYFVRGVNRHQDHLGKGWAIRTADMEQDVALLREMGANAVRCCHYQHSTDFYAACDRAGLLAWAELPLVNTIHTGTEFAATTQGQLLDLIRQNINHPSIFVWSLFNEQSGKPDPTELLRHLNSVAHAEDPTRPTIAATCVAKLPEMNKITDWLGWNRYPMWYGKETPGTSLDACHHTSRDGSFILSEYGAGASIKQHEQNPRQPPTKGKWHPEEWQMQVHESIWMAVKERPFIWGVLAWVMFDFSSQQRDEGDFPVRNDKGLVTGDRQVRKDAFFFYKANWTDAPMVHITSCRDNERHATVTPVKVYANTEQVELKVNGAPQGIKTPDAIRRAIWSDVHLKPGSNQIEAVGLRGDVRVTDYCTWHVATPSPAPSAP